MSQENVELTYQAYDAFNRRDLDAFLENVDPAVEFRSLLVGMEGSYHGREGIRRYWQDLATVSPDFTVEVVEVRDFGDRTLTELKARGHGAGSHILVEQTVWSVARAPASGEKADWIGNFATEEEALKAVGLTAE